MTKLIIFSIIYLILTCSCTCKSVNKTGHESEIDAEKVY